MILEDVLFRIIKQARADKDAKIAALKLEVESIEDILDATAMTRKKLTIFLKTLLEI
jgi:hypothetical protein